MSPKASTRAAASTPLQRYVALLRGVNVGGRVIKMDRLRQAFESMALENVQTFIASGNVIFDTAPRSTNALETMVEAGLEKAFDYPIATFIRTPEEMIAAARAPFAARDLEGAGLYVTFHKAEPSKGAAKKVMAMRCEDDDFAVVGREVYWLRRRLAERLGEPWPPLGKALELAGTTRNITTVQKIAAKYCGGAAAPARTSARGRRA